MGIEGKPKFSIVTVCYNSIETIEKTINSVLNQEFKDYEYIIIDGGSNDGTLEKIKEYSKGITLISEKDNGIYDAMNKAIELANGHYINFLNSGDNYYNSEILKLVSEKADNNKMDIIYGNAFIVDANDRKLKEVNALDFNLDNLLKKSTRTLCHQSLFVKKDIAPYYNLKYTYKGELNWYFDILKSKNNINSTYIPKPIVYYKLGGFGYVNYKKNFAERIIVIKDRFGLKKLIKISPHLIKSIVFHYGVIFRDKYVSPPR